PWPRPAPHSSPSTPGLACRPPACTGKTAWWSPPKPRSGGRTTSGSPSRTAGDRKSTRLNSSHLVISYAVFCLKKKNYKKLVLIPPLKGQGIPTVVLIAIVEKLDITSELISNASCTPTSITPPVAFLALMFYLK